MKRNSLRLRRLLRIRAGRKRQYRKERMIGLVWWTLDHTPLFVARSLARIYPSFFDVTAGMKPSPGRTWDRVRCDGCHIVIATSGLGQVVAINVKRKTLFAISGAPAQFSRVGARF